MLCRAWDAKCTWRADRSLRLCDGGFLPRLGLHVDDRKLIVVVAGIRLVLGYVCGRMKATPFVGRHGGLEGDLEIVEVRQVLEDLYRRTEPLD